MIKFETLGGEIAAKTNPVIKLDADVANYTFKEIDGILYLIMTELNGDDAYIDDTVLKAGTYLNGVIVKSLDGLKLVVDGKHITGGVDGKTVGTTLIANSDGTLKTGTATSGVYFKVTDVGLRLTEAAVKVMVMVADADTTVEVPATLSDLTDVDTTGATEGQVLKLNSDGTWVPATDATE